MFDKYDENTAVELSVAPLAAKGLGACVKAAAPEAMIRKVPVIFMVNQRVLLLKRVVR
jgi:hypothetical protein